MKRLPQAYMIFREELHRVKLEKKKLKEEYEQYIQQMNQEISFLKEQIDSQHQMLSNSIDYANRLENQLEYFQGKLLKDEQRLREGIH